MTAPGTPQTSAGAPLQGPELLDLELAGEAAVPPPTPEEQERERVEQKVAEIVLALRQRVGQLRAAVDRNTYLNEAFVQDAQYVEWDPARRVVQNVPAPRDAIRRTLNLMQPFTRAMQSRLTRGYPTYQVTGDSSDPNAEDVGELGNDLIPTVETWIEMERVRDQIAFWQLRGGTAVCFDLWDRAGGKPPAPGAPPPGIPYTDVHPPHEVFYFPSTATAVHTAMGIGRDVRMTKGEALTLYPRLTGKLPGITSAGIGATGVDMSRAIRHIAPGQQGWKTQEQLGQTAVDWGEDDEEVLVEFFLRPGGILMATGDQEVFVFPAGLHLVTSTDGVVGHFEGNEYEDLPATRIGFAESAGFWSSAPCTALRPMQMAINWAYSLWEQSMMLVGRPVMLWPRQARAHWRRLQEFTQKILVFSAGTKGEKPEFLDPPPSPAQLPDILQFLLTVWQDVAGLHEVSRGQLPAAGISGVAIQLLQDQDDSQIGFSVKQLEDGLAHLMQHHLDHVRRFLDGELLLKLSGNSAHQTRLFQATDLGAGVVVRVVRGSALPKSPAALEAKAKEAWLGGYLLDEYQQPDWRRLLTLQGLGNSERLYDELQQDKNIAATEEELLLQLDPETVVLALTFYNVTGALPAEFMPKPYEDHIIHAARHRRTLKELREQQLSGTGAVPPDRLALLEAHWQVTELFAQIQRAGMGTMAGFGAATGQVTPQMGGAGGTGGQPNSGPNGGKPAVERPAAQPASS